MTAVRKQRRRRRPIYIAALTVLAAGLVVAFGASAANSIGGNFEIDENANLIANDPAPSIDWVSVQEIRQPDLATGQKDDSYGGGSKEDDPCPTVGDGSIPNNKSDLLNFGAYVEGEVGGPGFLNLFWNRVTEPSGTTLMDFELNKSGVACANGVNKVRTAGDILLQYAIEQGGAVATITAREWTGSQWGPEAAIPGAIGTINTAPILAANSDGLGAMNARTFGEMSLDLDFIFDSGTCESFGSAMVKSRSSDAFTSQLKDFIRPVPVNISNCATVIIRKQTDPDEAGNTTQFGYTKSFSTSPATGNTFQLTDDDSETFNGVLIGNGYTVVEDAIGAGYDFVNVDCSASTGVSPSINGATVTFGLDSATDILDCTYNNRARGSIIVKKVTTDGQGAFGFTSSTLTSPFTLTTTAPGEAGSDSDTFSNLNPGTYDVAETEPAGWNLTSASCSDGSPVSAISLQGGETITCTFTNARERGAILITKLRKHAAGGPEDQPHPGVTFNVDGVPVITNGNGQACVDNLLLGDHTVTETLPGGYINVGPLEQTIAVVAEGTCSTGVQAQAAFHNMPLTNITVSVDSQVDGGTSSVIECGGDPVTTGANGDGSLTVSDLQPTAPTVTLTCTIVVDP